MSYTRVFSIAVVGLVCSVVLAGCGRKAKPDELAILELAALKSKGDAEAANLANFDDLDFNIFSGQKWEELGRSHAPDIVVHWPDGRTTTGIEKHVEDLKKMFVWAPDMRIQEHPIKIASGDWTAVTGVMEGTFSQPMPAGAGQTIPPTGKTFKIDMVTIGHWKGGVMDEEYLFWDNQAFMEQIGVEK